jgi:MYXO-CTERM domain-containing protein
MRSATHLAASLVVAGVLSAAAPAFAQSGSSNTNQSAGAGQTSEQQDSRGNWGWLGLLGLAGLAGLRRRDNNTVPQRNVNAGGRA